jgi:glycosyltransferase involved in cell wall biosynthesis
MNLIPTKTICHVTSSHKRFDTRIFLKECKSLYSFGYKVYLIVNDKNIDEIVDNISIISTGTNPLGKYTKFINSYPKIKKHILKINADIYHFHDPELLFLAHWTKKKGKKVIFDFHESLPAQLYFKEKIPFLFKFFLIKLVVFFEKNLSRKFDGLITVTTEHFDIYKLYNPNTIIITNYPIIQNISFLNSNDKPYSFVFAGNVSRQWNIETVLKSLQINKNLKFGLAGNINSSYLNELSLLNGWNNVDFLGTIDSKKIVSLYSQSKIGIALLDFDSQVGKKGTLGNTKLFEYMANGLPVICSNNFLWSSIIKEFNCGYSIDPKDNVLFLRYANNILNNSELYELMSKNSRKAVIEKYNWNTQESKLKDFYNYIFNLKN